jgi:hypothetical protein
VSEGPPRARAVSNGFRCCPAVTGRPDLPFLAVCQVEPGAQCGRRSCRPPIAKRAWLAFAKRMVLVLVLLVLVLARVWPSASCSWHRCWQAAGGQSLEALGSVGAEQRTVLTDGQSENGEQPSVTRTRIPAQMKGRSKHASWVARAAGLRCPNQAPTDANTHKAAGVPACLAQETEPGPPPIWCEVRTSTRTRLAIMAERPKLRAQPSDTRAFPPRIRSSQSPGQLSALYSNT